MIDMCLLKKRHGRVNEDDHSITYYYCQMLKIYVSWRARKYHDILIKTSSLKHGPELSGASFHLAHISCIQAMCTGFSSLPPAIEVAFYLPIPFHHTSR